MTFFRRQLSIFFWRILKHSIVFKYFYSNFLNELMFDLEIFDLDKERITQKYLSRLEKFNVFCKKKILPRSPV